MTTKTKERTGKTKKPTAKQAGKIFSGRAIKMSHSKTLKKPMAGDHVVRARISRSLNRRASLVLHKIGLSQSDAIRLLMVKICEEGHMPFEIDYPNAVSRAAIKDAQVGKVVRHTTIKSLMDDLNA